MTETKAVMAQEEFEQEHSRSWDYVARVGRVWEGIAEAQQTIIDGKGYRYLGYPSWITYWDGEFAEQSGWSSNAVKNWLEARRIKGNTPFASAFDYDSIGPDRWRKMRNLEPEERVEFLDRYEELKPQGSRYPFPEAMKKFQEERETGVIERMREEHVVVPAYPTGPSPEEEAYNAASQLLSVAMDVTPEAAADSVSPGLAQTTAQRYEALIPWTRRFVAQLHFRASGARGER